MDIVFVPLNSCRVTAQEAMGACEGLVVIQGYKVIQLFSARPVGNGDDCAPAHTIFSHPTRLEPFILHQRPVGCHTLLGLLYDRDILRPHI